MCRAKAKAVLWVWKRTAVRDEQQHSGREGIKVHCIYSSSEDGALATHWHVTHFHTLYVVTQVPAAIPLLSRGLNKRKGESGW